MQCKVHNAGYLVASVPMAYPRYLQCNANPIKQDSLLLGYLGLTIGICNVSKIYNVSLGK